MNIAAQSPLADRLLAAGPAADLGEGGLLLVPDDGLEARLLEDRAERIRGDDEAGLGTVSPRDGVMELVAAAKLRRAELRIKALRPYAETMNELIAGVGRASSSAYCAAMNRP